MEFAIICPVGPLFKWGYEHTFEACLMNQARGAAALYLVHSLADLSGMERLAGHSNIVSMCGPETWFHPEGLAPDDVAFGDYSGHNFTTLHERNYRLGRHRAWRDGFNLVVYTHSNWYVPEAQWPILRGALERLVLECQDYGVMNRRAQVQDWIIAPDKAARLLINMTEWSEEQVRLREHDRKLRAANVLPGAPEFVDCSSEATPEQISANFLRFDPRRITPASVVVAMQHLVSGMAKERVTDRTGLGIARTSKLGSIASLIDSTGGGS